MSKRQGRRASGATRRSNILERSNAAVLPPERATYVHYFSTQQRRLQHLLEESAAIKKQELETFVRDAERICYIDGVCRRLAAPRTYFSRLRSFFCSFGIRFYVRNRASHGRVNRRFSQQPHQSSERRASAWSRSHFKLERFCSSSDSGSESGASGRLPQTAMDVQEFDSLIAQGEKQRE